MAVELLEGLKESLIYAIRMLTINFDPEPSSGQLDRVTVSFIS